MNISDSAITIIACSITAISAIIAPAVSAYIQVRYQYKIKTIDLFFNAKLKAYHDFMEATIDLPSSDSQVLKNFDHMSAAALLLSTPETQAAIALYGQALIENVPSEIIGNVQANAILAMQKDLNEFDNYRNKDKNT